MRNDLSVTPVAMNVTIVRFDASEMLAK